MDAPTFLRDNRDVLLARWEAMARDRIEAARATEPLALRDHMPVMLERIEEALAKVGEGCGGRAAAEQVVSSRSSAEHGRHRASVAGYTVDQIMHEYMILREVAVEAARESGCWNDEISEAIARVVELTVLIAAAEFSKSIDEVQQKLVGALAHDIRTPLSTIRVMLSMIKDRKGEGADELFAAAERGVARSVEMLDGLLESVFARAGDGMMLSFEEGDFAQEFAKGCEEVRRTYPARVEARCPRGPIPGVFDAAALRRIFDNLVSNAARYGELGSPVEVWLEDRGESVAISVRNQGEPIPESKRKEIFGFLSKNGAKAVDGLRSWGIGLAYVKLAAEGHNGRVSVESSAEAGTTFRVTIPKHSRQPGRVRARSLREA